MDISEAEGQDGLRETAAATAGGDTPEVDPARQQFIEQWAARIKDAKKHYEAPFRRMRRNMEYAKTGAAKAWADEEKYIANIVQRHVNQRVATLYAKNPRAVAKRRNRMAFQVWDGNPQTLMQAQQQIMAAQQAAPGADPAQLAPQAAMLLQDVAEGERRKQLIDRVGRTLENLFHYFLDEQHPTFKVQAKRLVRRTVVTGVGFCKLGFLRLHEPKPELAAQSADVTNRVQHIQQLVQEASENGADPEGPGMEELRNALTQLQGQQQVIAHEGLVFDFPRSTEIIVDPECRSLPGFIGATWIAHEFHMTPEKVQETYEVDLGSTYTGYSKTNPQQREPHNKKEKGLVLIWEVQDKTGGTVFTIADGHPDYLRAPAGPDVELEQFFNVFALVFNDIEDEEAIYPPSDVELIRPMQDEYNRARHGLREHRAFNRPKYLSTAGQLEEEDKDALKTGGSNLLIELKGMPPGTDAAKIVQPMQFSPIDPNVYEVNPIFEDVLRTVGSQEAVLGPTSGATATESSIAEQARSQSVDSNVDDLDDFLTALARASGQVLLAEMSPEKVKKIAGRGAVWPEFSQQDIADELYLSVKAGSSGRPNKAQELANMERVGPLLMQVPGISPTWLAQQLLRRMEDDLDLEEALIEGMPSITALNSMAGKQADQGEGGNGQEKPDGGGASKSGSPDQQPQQQGGQGANNTPSTQQNEPGPQPAMPAAGAVPGLGRQ